jgi:hypothetical protein
VVLNGLDHHLMLLGSAGDLHTPGTSNRGMRDIAVARNLVRRVHDHDPFADLVGKHTRHFTEHRRLANTRPPKKQNTLPGTNQVVDDLTCTKYRPSDSAGHAHRTTSTISDNRNTVKRSLNSGAIVIAKLTYSFDDPLEVGVGDFLITQLESFVREARLWRATQVHYDLK